MKITIEKTNPRNNKRLKAFRQVMEEAIEHLSPFYKKIDGYSIHLRPDFHIVDVAARQVGRELEFIFKDSDIMPDVASLTWLLEHEITHFHLQHAYSGKSLTQMENEALEFQQRNGMQWHNGLVYKSSIIMNE